MVSNRNTFRTSFFILVFVLLIMAVKPVYGTGNIPLHPGPSNSDAIEFALTGEATGWLKVGNRIFRTESNGAEWREVTPLMNQDESLVDVYFSDSNRAYALILTETGEELRLDLLQTIDSGSSWQAKPVIFSDSTHGLQDLPFGNAFLQWQGKENGWILVKQAASSNFSAGLLLHTSDGGESWQVNEPPAAEDFIFMDENLGFMADPVDAASLYQTQDGGKSWQSIQPPGANSSDGALQRLGLPTQWRSGELLFPAWTTQGESEPELVFLAAQLGQQTLAEGTEWTITSTAIDPLSWQDSFGSDLAFTGISSFEGEYLWLGLSDASCQMDALEDDGAMPQSTLICQNKVFLLASDTGGEHWEAINLPYEIFSSTVSASEIGFFQDLPEVGQRLNTVQWVQIYRGQGFDACEIPTLSELQAWFNGSPYKAVNLYIGGISRACANNALTAAYLQQMFNQGWRFIPTWVGPQAPCTSFRNRFSSDPAVAYNQGVDNANQARARLMELGLTNPDGTGSVVYDDLEYFPYSSTCSAAARAFVQGWSTRLQELGIVSGLYASSRNLDQNEIYNLQPPPWAVWIAEWYRVPGYRPDVTVWDVDWLDDMYWSHHQRVYQYSGSHDETWGGVTINVDSNVLDGYVAAPYGSDLIAPVTSYRESGTIGISPWYKTPVTVTLTATDNSVGVKHTYFRINSGNWQLYSVPFQVAGSGQMTIYYVSVDRVNNWEALKSASFYVDSEPPINPRVTSPGCQAWNGVPQAWCNDPWFTWAGAYDRGVGLNTADTYEFYWGTNKNATSGTYTTATRYNPTAVPTGIPYYLRIRTQDKQGLWSAWQTIYTFIYDYRFRHQFWLPRVTK